MHTLGHRTVVAAGAALGLGALLAVAVWSVASERMAARLLDMDEACAQGRPYLVAVCHDIGVAADVDRGRLPALVVFRDSPDSRGHLGLAATDELGSLWGLACSRSERALYAGAFRRRGVGLQAASAPSTGSTWSRARPPSSRTWRVPRPTSPSPAGGTSGPWRR